MSASSGPPGGRPWDAPERSHPARRRPGLRGYPVPWITASLSRLSRPLFPTFGENAVTAEVAALWMALVALIAAIAAPVLQHLWTSGPVTPKVKTVSAVVAVLAVASGVAVAVLGSFGSAPPVVGDDGTVASATPSSPTTEAARSPATAVSSSAESPASPSQVPAADPGIVRFDIEPEPDQTQSSENVFPVDKWGNKRSVEYRYVIFDTRGRFSGSCTINVETVNTDTGQLEEPQIDTCRSGTWQTPYLPPGRYRQTSKMFVPELRQSLEVVWNYELVP